MHPLFIPGLSFAAWRRFRMLPAWPCRSLPPCCLALLRQSNVCSVHTRWRAKDTGSARLIKHSAVYMFQMPGLLLISFFIKEFQGAGSFIWHMLAFHLRREAIDLSWAAGGGFVWENCLTVARLEKNSTTKCTVKKGKGKVTCVSVALAIFPWTHRLGFFQTGLVQPVTELKDGVTERKERGGNERNSQKVSTTKEAKWRRASVVWKTKGWETLKQIGWGREQRGRWDAEVYPESTLFN